MRSNPKAAKQYRLILKHHRGRLFARTTKPDVLDIQVLWPAGGKDGSRTVRCWQNGPVRSCNLVLEALGGALSKLGRDVTPKSVMALARKIDRQLYERLIEYVLLRAGRYDSLLDRVLCPSPSNLQPAGRAQSLGWVAAEVVPTTGARKREDASMTRQNDCAAREVLVLIRGRIGWELWWRRESAYFPHRVQRCLCATAVLPDEPHLVAELLAYHAVQRHAIGASIIAAERGLISVDRMAHLHGRIEARLASIENA